MRNFPQFEQNIVQWRPSAVYHADQITDAADYLRRAVNDPAAWWRCSDPILPN